MTREGRIASKAIEKASGKPLEEANKIYEEALNEIGKVRRKYNKNISNNSWNVTPKNR